MRAGGVQLRCGVEAAVFAAALPLASGVHSVMHAVQCPVTLARGEPRPGAPDAFIAGATAALAEAAPHGALQTLQGMGHFAPFSHPAALARDVERRLLDPPQTALPRQGRESKL